VPNPRPRRGHLQQQGTRRVEGWRGVAPSTPRGGAPRYTAGSWLALDAYSHLATHQFRHAQPAPTERRPPGINAASSRPPTTITRRGHAVPNPRPRRGHLQQQGTRRVEGWRASLRRRRGDAHRDTPPGRGWPSTRIRISQRISFATRNRRRRSGALQGSTRPQRGRLQQSPAGVTRCQTRGLGEATSNNRVPEGLKDGGRRSVDAAGTRTAIHRRVVVGPRRVFASRNASVSPRATGADGAAPSRDQRGLSEAASNNHPQGSRGAKPAASARPPPTTGYTKG
jgi:hypothetical protein